MSQRLLETDFPSASVAKAQHRHYQPAQIVSAKRGPGNRPTNLRPLSTSGSMPRNLMASVGGSAAASEWQYEPTFRTGSMSRVQTSFSVRDNSSTQQRTGSLRKAFNSATSDEDEDGLEMVEESRPLQHTVHQKQNQSKVKQNSQSSTSDYHSDENPNLLPVEHRELPQFRLHQLNNR